MVSWADYDRCTPEQRAILQAICWDKVAVQAWRAGIRTFADAEAYFRHYLELHPVEGYNQSPRDGSACTQRREGRAGKG
jgi:hypothetical protein